MMEIRLNNPESIKLIEDAAAKYAMEPAHFAKAMMSIGFSIWRATQVPVPVEVVTNTQDVEESIRSQTP